MPNLVVKHSVLENKNPVRYLCDVRAVRYQYQRRALFRSKLGKEC